MAIVWKYQIVYFSLLMGSAHLLLMLMFPFVLFVLTKHLVIIMVCSLVKDVKVSLKELFKNNSCIHAKITTAVMSTSLQEINAKLVDSRNVLQVEC